MLQSCCRAAVGLPIGCGAAGNHCLCMQIRPGYSGLLMLPHSWAPATRSQPLTYCLLTPAAERAPRADIWSPKFNIVSPGADSEIYFPYT